MRHGHGPHRAIQTGAGPVEVRRAKMRDRGDVGSEEKIRFTSSILPKWARLSVQLNMKADLREIYGAPTRAAAEAAIDMFADKYGTKYDKAVACLTKDREALLAFFDFPAEHWDHLRTSNPIESVFATVRHRTVWTKGALSAKTAKLMVFKLVIAAAKTWRRLKGENQLPKVVPRRQIPKRHRGHQNAGSPRRRWTLPAWDYPSSLANRTIRRAPSHSSTQLTSWEALPMAS